MVGRPQCVCDLLTSRLMAKVGTVRDANFIEGEEFVSGRNIHVFKRKYGIFDGTMR